MRTIDLNCDLGESEGGAGVLRDAAIMDYVSSVNVACGFHAGSPSVMHATARSALERGTAVGAHPSFWDRENFGRSRRDIGPDEVFDTVLYQVSAMKGICEALGGRLNHVKPHGALYNQAAADEGLAVAVASAVKACDPGLVLYGLSGSELVSAAEKLGLRAASEVFADRTYRGDGSLTPRTEPNALIEEVRSAVAQVVQMVETGTVTSTEGKSVRILADTVCIHGDGPDALSFAKALHSELSSRGIQIRKW